MTTIIAAKTIGMTKAEVKAIHSFLTVERQEAISTSIKKWLAIGDACTRIKNAKLDGKFSDLVNTFFGTPLTNDERQYSMKLHDLEAKIIEWYKESGCLKYNPRTIYTAYQAFLKGPEEEKTEDEKTAEKAEKKEVELRKERSGADTLKAMAEYKRIRDNASENGNLVLGDLETILQELKNEIKLIVGMIDFEKPADDIAKIDESKAA